MDMVEHQFHAHPKPRRMRKVLPNWEIPETSVPLRPKARKLPI